MVLTSEVFKKPTPPSQASFVKHLYIEQNKLLGAIISTET